MAKVFVSEPFEDQIDQLVDRMAAVLACDLLVQVPQDAFDRIGFGCVFLQEVKRDPVPTAVEEFVDEPAVMKAGVITDDVNVSVAAPSATQTLARLSKEHTAARVHRPPN